MAVNPHEDGGVDEWLPLPKLTALGLQHVMVMYAGAVAVPLIVAGALGLPPEQRAIRNNRNNLFIVAIALGFGLIPTVAPEFFRNFYGPLRPVLGSGIILTTRVAVVLNAYCNGVASTDTAEHQLADAARAADQ